MARKEGGRSLSQADWVWQKEGWVPTVGVFLLSIVGIALFGSPTQTASSGTSSFGPAESAMGVVSALGRQSVDSLTDAGLFFAPSAPWLIEILVALVVAAAALPALRDLSARAARGGAPEVEDLARRVLALEDDEMVFVLRRDMPGLALDLTLRKFAGVMSQAIAVLGSVVWVTTLVAVVRTTSGAVPDDAALTAARGVLFAAPFVIAIATVTSLYRITPERTRLQRLIAMIMDERATRARATPYTPAYSRTTAMWLRWSIRVGGVVTLTGGWVAISLVQTWAAGSISQPIPLPPEQVVGTTLLGLLIVAIVWTIFDAIASGMVIARFWIGGRTGIVLVLVLAILLIVVSASFVASVIAPTVLAGDWPSFVVCTALLVVPTVGMGLPVVVKYQKPLFFSPGYTLLPGIQQSLGRLIDTYSSEAVLRLPTVQEVRERTLWERLTHRPAELPPAGAASTIRRPTSSRRRRLYRV